ncbi:MAG: DUF4910 domain-containing protein [Clostridiales bacterium]|nr:DUF4910 domain-containing protein [Clostridiales bacterium]
MDYLGKDMYELAEKLFPICRSITGDGVRQTLNIINDFLSDNDSNPNLKLNIHEVQSGTQVFDWNVPKEWKIREAYIEDENGKHIIDMKENNLHVMGYSVPVDMWVSLPELKEHVFVEEDNPVAVPYVTSYYKERYGFCMSKNQLDALPEGKYHMYIDSELFDGSLTYAEAVLKGETDEEILLSSYTCHPSMANNECSGPVVLAALMKYVASLENRRYTYRFLLNPETIGSLTYLSINYKMLQEKLVAGIVLSCVGDDRDYSIIKSRYGNTITDKSLKSILSSRGKYSEYSFLERGSDERQYNAPGIDLSVVGFCRSKYGEFPEYHTSLDNLDLISPSGLQGSYEVMVQWIQAMEYNRKYQVTVLGEPQLGKRGLYPTISKKNMYDNINALRDFIAYADGSNDIFEISDIIGVPVSNLLPIIRKLKDNDLIRG